MPDDYIGGKSLSALATYLSGFQMALIIGEGKFDSKKFFQDDFYNFVANNLNNHSMGKHWLKLILSKTNNNEEKALICFANF